MQFTVKVHVTGGMGLPSYDTSVNVDARDVNQKCGVGRVRWHAPRCAPCISSLL